MSNEPYPKRPIASNLDLAGLGKLAEAIPPEVYTRTTVSLVSTFESLVSPLTATTDGLGRYIRQRFDNMLEIEKAVAVYSLEAACQRAKLRLGGAEANSPQHPKTFVKSLEEASKETDPLLHEMWVNLLAAQMTPAGCHPHFAQILPHFGPNEAQLLISLVEREHVGDHKGSYLSFGFDFDHMWKRQSSDSELNKWSYSCTFLCTQGFADVLSGRSDIRDPNFSLLYRTRAGSEFLKTVSASDPKSA